ncbi:MAG: hypothetical protein AB1446_04510 [Bacillota bacterium]
MRRRRVLVILVSAVMVLGVLWVGPGSPGAVAARRGAAPSLP